MKTIYIVTSGEYSSYLYYCCMAKDENHAIKQANEKRIFLIADNKWSVSK